jgi:two-component system nitrate/nitrite response regulator NarL
MPSTVLIVADHPLFRRGMAELLAMDPEIEVIGAAAHVTAAVEMVRGRDPDMILLDLNLKTATGAAESGIDVLAAVKDEDPSRRVVMLTVSDAPDDLMHAIRAGADGYLLKDLQSEELRARVREALTGKTVICDALASRLAVPLREEAQDGARMGQRDLALLTDREQAVLRCIADGQSNKLIARTLSITEGTVKVHVKHLLKELGFRSRVEAAVWATELGLRDSAAR